MLPANFVQLAILTAAFASAVPLEQFQPAANATLELFSKRANPAPVSCGPTDNQRAWPLESVQDAFNALVTNGRLSANQRPAAGTRTYPRQYGNNQGVPSDPDVVAALNAIPECQTGMASTLGKFFEFPITDPVFAGGIQGSQGPDRVIAVSPNPGQGGMRQYTYCLAVTHRGESGGAFATCTNSP